jgi:magnesium-transporting ATPase (P-type)
MVTGDNLMTARAIAIECGIINPENKDSLVMNGSDFIEKVGGVICKNC